MTRDQPRLPEEQASNSKRKWSGSPRSSAGVVLALLLGCGGTEQTVGTGSTLPKSHALSVVLSGAGTVRSSPAGIDCGAVCSAVFDEGGSVTLTATGASGTRFSGWGGACSGTGSCTVKMDADATVRATFIVTSPAPPPPAPPPPPGPPPPAPPPPAPPPPTADCAGVVPDQLGDSFNFTVESHFSRSVACDAATSDESGNLAVGIGLSSGPAGDVDREWQTFDSSGSPLATFSAGFLFPQGEGFEGLFFQDPESFLVGLWSPQGNRTSGPVVGGKFLPAAFRAWPNGILTASIACDAPAEERATYIMRRLDSGLNQVAQGSTPRDDFACALMAGGVGDANGNSLLVVVGTGADGFAAGDLVGRWFDASENPMTGWFRLGSGGGNGHSFLVHALVGGGAAAQVDGQWTWFIPSGKAEVQPAPAFLSANPQSDFTLVRGGKAYAVVSRGGGDPTEMKLYSSAGNSCGSVKFPGGGLTTGADGSVIGSSGDFGCTKTVWPGLLR